MNIAMLPLRSAIRNWVYALSDEERAEIPLGIIAIAACKWTLQIKIIGRDSCYQEDHRYEYFGWLDFEEWEYLPKNYSQLIELARDCYLITYLSACTLNEVDDYAER